MTTPTPLPDNRPLCVVTGHPCGSDTVRVGTDCPSTSGRCVHKSQSSFTQQNMTTPTPTGIEEMKREHDALILKGRPLMDELEAMTVRVNELRKLIEESDPDEYDGIRLLFEGTFYGPNKPE